LGAVPLPRVTLCVGLALVAAAAVSACGDDGSAELRARDASALRAALDEVEQRVSGQDCAGASQQAAAFRERVGGLPQRVDADLRRALASSAERLETLVADQCTAAPAAPTETPPAGTTSPDQAEGQDGNQPGKDKEDKQPKQEKPNPDQTQTQTQPDTGGTGEEVPGVGNEGGGTPPGQ
jgi:hypothetical protein